MLWENRTRQAFATVRQIKGKFGQRVRSIKSKSGVMLTDKDEIKDRWIEYIRDLFTDCSTYKKEALEELKARAVPNEEDEEITLVEVEKAIKKLKNNILDMTAYQ